MTDSQQFDAWQRETYRKSMDTILVWNPTHSDYICYWDKYPHVIPSCDKDLGFGLGKMQLVRYIADKYMKEMKDKLISEKADDILKKAKETRAEKGQSVDPYEVNTGVMNILPKTSDEKEIERIYGLLYCGLVREFGLYETAAPAEEVKLDQRTPEEKAMDKVTAKSVPKAENSVVIEPEDVTTAPKKYEVRDGDVYYNPKAKEEPKKSRLV